MRYAWFLFIALALIYYLNNRIFGPKVGGLLGNYILPTLAWALIALYVVWLPRVRYKAKKRHRRLMRWLAGMCAFIAVLGLMIQGAMGGFGESPYDHSWKGILINVVTIGAALVATEMARAWLMNRCFKRRPALGFGVIAVFFSILGMPLNKWLNINWGLPFAQFIGSDFCPLIGQNVLTTYLAYLGGPVPAIIYRGALLAAERFSPVLPNANWASQTLLGLLVPVLGMILVKQLYAEENKETRMAARGDNLISWVMTSVASIVIVWFAMGVFTYAPRVILSGSMEPDIKIGDVVIIHKISGEEAGMGDIILFPHSKDMKVTHRIISVKTEEKQRFFTTKGDANPEPDTDLVPEENVQGKVVAVVPKMGWLSLMLRGAIK